MENMKKFLIIILCCTLSVSFLTACGKEQTKNEEVQEEKIYSVELTDIGDDWVSVVKSYRDLTGLNIKEARDKVVAAPCILLETSSQEEAELYKTTLEECGATVKISESPREVNV